MMSLLIPGLLATSVLFASGILQFNAFKKGEVHDVTSLLLGIAGCILSVILVVQGLGDNGGRPTTGLMGTLLGALLLLIVLGSSFKHPVNALLIGVAPLTGLFTLVTSVIGPVSSQLNPLNFETAVHVATSIVAYGAIAYAGTLAILLSWQHAKLKERPLTPVIAALPPLDAMEHLFLRTVQTAWVVLTVALLTGVVYVEDFWAQHLAHKTALSVLAWCGMALALGQHFKEGGVTRTMRKTAITAAALLCIGYLGSKAILEFVL
jgi:ABC-type uncharacterized transport system permease subunit